MANVHELKTRGQAALREGRIPEALDQYLQAGRKASKDAEIWHMLAVLHGMSGNNDEAEICCRKVISLQPNAHAAYNNLGTILKNKGRLDEAATCYRKVLDLAPNNASAANNLATLLREAGDRDGAFTLYQNAVRVKPDFAEAYSNLGSLLQDDGRIIEALQCYQRAVQLQPSNAAWLFNFGCGLREAGRMEESAQAFQRAVQFDPNNARAWDGLSHVQLELRQFEEALENGMRAIELQPNLVDAHLHTGAAFQALQRTEEAADQYRHALSIDPGNVTASYFLAIMGVNKAPDKSPAEYVTKLFDNYAETFDDSLVNKLEYRTPTLLHQLAGRHLDPEKGKLNVIDLGCGTGLCGPLFRPLARRLVGVDLSSKMVTKARERQVYDELLVDDLIPPLLTNPQGFDLVLAADVFVYIGDLGPVFKATAASLRPSGLFMFSTEKDESGRDFVLRNSGRYAHSMNYVTNLATGLDFEVVSTEDVMLRKEGGKDIQGNVYVLRQS
jgi:predicted TPR repeat methyltransferase